MILPGLFPLNSKADVRLFGCADCDAMMLVSHSYAKGIRTDHQILRAIAFMASNVQPPCINPIMSHAVVCMRVKDFIRQRLSIPNIYRIIECYGASIREDTIEEKQRSQQMI